MKRFTCYVSTKGKEWVLDEYVYCSKNLVAKRANRNGYNSSKFEKLPNNICAFTDSILLASKVANNSSYRTSRLVHPFSNELHCMHHRPHNFGGNSARPSSLHVRIDFPLDESSSPLPPLLLEINLLSLIFYHYNAKTWMAWRCGVTTTLFRDEAEVGSRHNPHTRNAKKNNDLHGVGWNFLVDRWCVLFSWIRIVLLFIRV